MYKNQDKNKLKYPVLARRHDETVRRCGNLSANSKQIAALRKSSVRNDNVN
jgi:hypothetical protein